MSKIKYGKSYKLSFNNITNYNFEVPNDVKDLNILVVPENEKAKVKIIH